MIEMLGDAYNALSQVILHTPVLPFLWTAHCILMCRAVRAVTGDQEFHQENPLSSLLISTIYTFPGGILSQLALGNPPLTFLTNTWQFGNFVITWYLMNFTRLNFINKISFVTPILLIGQDWLRLNLVLTGVNSVLSEFPEAFIYPVFIATLKSSGFVVVKYLEQVLMHGLNKPFKVTSHYTKTMVLAACLLVAQSRGLVKMDQGELFSVMVMVLMIIRISDTMGILRSSDPYGGIETTICSTIFGEGKNKTENLKTKKKE